MRWWMAILVLALACGDDDGAPTDGGPGDALPDVPGDAPRLDSGFDAGPPPTDAPYRGPWVLQAETDRVLVRWETYELEPDEVGVVVTPEDGGEALTFTGSTVTEELTFSFENAFTELPDPAGTFHLHSVVVDGLDPATCYAYTIVGFPEDGGRFCTMHEPTDHTTPIEFMVIGDTSPFLGQSQQVLEHALADPIEMTVHVGDIQYYDALGETWNLWFRDMAPMIEAGAFFPVIGNHEDEQEGEFEATYARWFPDASRDGNMSRYHVESGGVHFFAVNSETDIGEYDADFSWLDEAITDAEGTEGYRFSVVWFHRPAYTLARHAPSIRVRDAIEPIITAHSVPIVFQGHNHVYERFEVGSTTWIVSGGGGSGRYDLDTHVESRPDEAAMRVAAGRFHHAVRIRITDGNLHGDAIDVDGVTQDAFDITVP